MSRQMQGSVQLVGVLSAAVALVALLVMVAIGGMTFLRAFFLALGIGVVSALVLFRAMRPSGEPPQATRAALGAGVERAAAVTPGSEAAPAVTRSSATEPNRPQDSSPEMKSAAGVDALAGSAAAPATLAEPRNGKADDLKKIKGVGPKLEAILNDLGFYHFDQIANWSAEEIAWVDENLSGFKGRATRDDWVGQAKTLAGDDRTENSKG